MHVVNDFKIPQIFCPRPCPVTRTRPPRLLLELVRVVGVAVAAVVAVHVFTCSHGTMLLEKKILCLHLDESIL